VPETLNKRAILAVNWWKAGGVNYPGDLLCRILL
jgi:hypothetical protein